ncbi:MAG: type II toxin-antitoxin system RelE/ParE family toxin [Bdellovibrionales bacterium]
MHIFIEAKDSCYNVSFVVHMESMISKILPARFFRSESGKEPVKDWLLSLSVHDRKVIGDDIRAVEFGWPIGMPLCRSINGVRGLWEIRIDLSQGRIARVFFCAHKGSMVLLHGFIKKSQKTPEKEIALATKRMKGIEK